MEIFLLITNADMSLQSGNIVLINRRAEELFKQFNIKTTCIVIKKNYTKKINHIIEGIEYITTSNKKDIKYFIINYKPKKIILYGVGAFHYVHYLKKVIEGLSEHIELLLDVQSALEESIEYNEGSKLFQFAKYYLKKRIFSNAINSVNGALVVSDELKGYCLSFLNKGNRNKFVLYKIRCGINEVIYTEQKMQWRSIVRKQWGIDENTIVMVFSGYRMPWQKIDSIIEIFKEYDKKVDKIFFAFFCNLDEDFETNININFPRGNYKLSFLSFNEYFKYLSACDVGFLLRDYNTTNKVAFPNKFSDYLNAGLIVAINKALPEPYRILEHNNISYIDIEETNYHESINRIMKRQNDIIKFYTLSEELCREELLYSNQVFKTSIQKYK